MALVNDTYSNYGASTVAGGAGGIGTVLLAGDTTLHLSTGDGAKFPTLSGGQTFRIQIGSSEIAIVGGRSGDTLSSLTRGAEGTSATSASVGTVVALVLTAAQLADLTAGNFTGNLTTTGNIASSAGTLTIHGSSSLDNGLITTDGSGDVTLSGNLSTGQSSVAVPSSSGTITTSGVGVARVNPSGNVTGIILQAGTRAGQIVQVLNESAFTLTMAASGTSNVADGVSDAIAANATRIYTWDSGQSLWYVVGGGASIGDHFLVGSGGQNDSDLSSKIVIPGFSSHPDIRAGGTNDDEFDQNTAGTPSGWTLFGANSPACDTNTSLSMLHMTATTAGGGESWNGIYKASPSFPFTVTCKLADCDTQGPRAGVFVMDATTTNKLFTMMTLYNSGNGGLNQLWAYYANWTSLTSFGTSIDKGEFTQYLRLVVHAANNIDALWSRNGKAWITVTSGFATLVNATYVGVGVNPSGGAVNAYFDWIRFS